MAVLATLHDLAVGLVIGVIVALVICGLAYVTGRAAKRGQEMEFPRRRPEREQPIDLGAEYHRFRSNQDHYEDRHPDLVRRAG